MSNKPYVGDIGTEVIVDCGSDISTATVHKLLIKKPSGVEVTWDCALIPLEVQKMKYIIEDGDFDEEGDYLGQAYIENPDGKWSGETFSFSVYGEYE